MIDSYHGFNFLMCLKSPKSNQSTDALHMECYTLNQKNGKTPKSSHHHENSKLVKFPLKCLADPENQRN